MKNRTSIIIAHRLSTIRHADKIIVMRSGSIAETGTHDELMKIENGLYRRMVEKQLEPEDFFSNPE
jgi:subfamily B ATP-binding cassette protein MsbA